MCFIHKLKELQFPEKYSGGCLGNAVNQINDEIDADMFGPGIQMDIDCSEGSKGESHPGASGPAVFDSVVDEHPFVGTLGDGLGLEYFSESIGISWYGRKEPEVVFRIYVYRPSIRAIRAFTGLIPVVVVKPAPVLGPFRETESPVLIGDTSKAY